MAPRAKSVRYRIGDHLFDPSTGEVQPLARASKGDGARLAPQPARLLELLVERGGELATREEIRARLWPETHVDFDQSLHVCVRQIRSAFGDSGGAPSYVETLPRRGYRLMRPVQTVGAARRDSGERVGAKPLPALRSRSAVRRGLLAALAVALVALAVGLVSSRRPASGPGAIRLAIMPFELAASSGDSDDLARISESLVAHLSGARSGRLEVIGPRTTAAYSRFPFPQLDRMQEKLAVDYVINARFLARDGERQLLVELIRLEDRAHPWVKLYSSPLEWRAIAREVGERVLDALPSSPPGH